MPAVAVCSSAPQAQKCWRPARLSSALPLLPACSSLICSSAHCSLPIALALLDGCLVLALVLSKFWCLRIALLSLVAVASTVAVAVCCYRLNPERLAAPRQRANFPPQRQPPLLLARLPCAPQCPVRNASCVARSKSTRHSSGVPLCRPVSADVAHICRTKILSSTTT